jgi:predicted dehydrogenase
MTQQRILVIGTGSIGTRHAGNIEQLGGIAERLSLRELGLEGVLKHIAAAEAQGAVIATATQLRQPLMQACADSGLPVYVEKPVAYTREGLRAFYAAAAPVADRSIAGFMMRYHPLLSPLQDIVARDDVFRFDFEIGHDVTQWRANWSFGDSYAALPEGGGVLLDLCHELDLAHTLFPDAALRTVESLGHADFPGVDMATQIALAGPGQTGSVAMDYLAPVFSRVIRLRGQGAITECDLLTGTITRRLPDADPEITQVEFDRNAMFLGAMGDFMALLDGRTPPSGNPNIPRLDLARPSCEMIANAWADRQFCGTIDKAMT